MNFEKLLNDARNVSELEIVPDGDYNIQIVETWADQVNGYERLNFKFEIDGRGECIPNKISFFLPTGDEDPEKTRRTLIRLRQFYKCFNVDIDRCNASPRIFLKQRGKVAIKTDAQGYKTVTYFYAPEYSTKTTAKEYARRASR